MRIILNQTEITAMLQTVLNQNIFPKTQLKEFEVKGLRTQDGYQLEIVTEDVTNFVDLNDEETEDEIVELIFANLGTPITVPDSDPVNNLVSDPVSDQDKATESTKQKPLFETDEPTKPAEEAVELVPTTEAKGIFEEVTEESIGNASTTKDASDVFGQTDEEEDVDIFGNPSVKPVQEKDETESLFS